MYICITLNYFTKFLQLQNYTIYILAIFQIVIFYLTVNKINIIFSKIEKYDNSILNSINPSKIQVHKYKKRFHHVIYLTLFLIYIATGTLLLMESIIVLFLIVYISNLFYELIESFQTTTSSQFGLSIFKISFLISMLFLARLDSIFFIFYFSILLFYLFYKSNHFNQSKSNLIKISIIYIFTFVSIISIYLIYNKMNFGSFGTMSSEIKNKFPHFIFDDINIWGRVILFSNLVYFLILKFYEEINLKKIKILLVLTSITQILFAFCFQLNTAQWYWNFGYLSFSFLVFDLVLIVKNKFNLMYFEDLIKVSLLIVIVYIFLSKNNLADGFKNNHQIKHLVNNIKNKIPKDFKYSNKKNNIVIYSYDFPGRLAYYSNFQVIPFDGLILDKKYIQDLEENSMENFYKLKKINYLITPKNNYSDAKVIKRLNYQVQKVNNNSTDIKLTIFNPITLENGKSLKLEKNKLLFKTKNPLIKWQKEYNEIGIWDVSKMK